MDRISKGSIDIYSKLMGQLSPTKMRGVFIHLISMLIGGVISQFSTMSARKNERDKVHKRQKEIALKTLSRKSKKNDTDNQNKRIIEYDKQCAELKGKIDKTKENYKADIVKLKQDIDTISTDTSRLRSEHDLLLARVQNEKDHIASHTRTLKDIRKEASDEKKKAYESLSRKDAKIKDLKSKISEFETEV